MCCTTLVACPARESAAVLHRAQLPSYLVLLTSSGSVFGLFDTSAIMDTQAQLASSSLAGGASVAVSSVVAAKSPNITERTFFSI